MDNRFLGVASVIAVIDISAKIIALCFHYSIIVKDAKNDFELIEKKVSDILRVVESFSGRLDGPHIEKLLKPYLRELQELEKQLESAITHMPVERIISSLEGYKQTFTRALQVDQTQVPYSPPGGSKRSSPTLSDLILGFDQKPDLVTEDADPTQTTDDRGSFSFTGTKKGKKGKAEPVISPPPEPPAAEPATTFDDIKLDNVSLDDGVPISDMNFGDSGTSTNKMRKRTKTGCLTCRKRRIKCGEERPTCGNCSKSKRQCEGYNQRVVSETSMENWPNHLRQGSAIQYHTSMLPGTRNHPFRPSHAASGLPSIEGREAGWGLSTSKKEFWGPQDISKDANSGGDNPWGSAEKDSSGFDIDHDAFKAASAVEEELPEIDYWGLLESATAKSKKKKGKKDALIEESIPEPVPEPESTLGAEPEKKDEDDPWAFPSGNANFKEKKKKGAIELVPPPPPPRKPEPPAEPEPVPEHSPVYQDNDHEEDDRRSVLSGNSSLTLVSWASGYTAVELAGATIELQKIFQEDAHLIKLYRCALDDASIGPERLQRNISRLMMKMARDLKSEANKEIEKLTPYFVSRKARYVAQCIVEEFHDKPTAPQSYHDETNQAESDHDDDDNDDDMETAAPIDEDRFDDLAILRTFLVHSIAFQIFRERLTAFVLASESQPSVVEPAAETAVADVPSSSPWHFLNLIERTCEAVLVAAGCLEPPLQPSMARLIWYCRCGISFSSDVRECRPGGISRLIERMQRSNGTKVAGVSYNKDPAGQRYRFRPPPWFQSATRKLSSALTRSPIDQAGLVQYNTPTVSGASGAVNASLRPPQRELYLMSCIHRTEHHVNVLQDSIKQIATDRQLFYFLRNQLRAHRGRFTGVLSMRRVQRINFVKFFLHRRNVVQVRQHKTCCPQTHCECIPPQSKVLKPPMGSGEYECNPSGPPDTWPPVCPEFMMHMLHSPDCIDEDDAYILEQLPKKTYEKLQEATGPPPEGWGLYFQEDLEISSMIGVVFVALFLASLLFLVLWAVLMDDLQGGSGVGAYVLAAASIFGIWIATKSKKFG